MILHPYAPGIREDDQDACWRALDALRARYAVVDARCCGPDDYEAALRAVWGSEDLIVCEHDVAPTLEMVASLMACPHAVCAQAYRYWHPVADPPLAAYVHAVHERTGTRQVREGEQWADAVALGLTKVSRQTQRALGVGVFATAQGGQWRNLDARLSLGMIAHGVRGHIHWPVVRHHHVPKTATPEPMPPIPAGALCHDCVHHWDCGLLRDCLSRNLTQPVTDCTHFTANGGGTNG